MINPQMIRSMSDELASLQKNAAPADRRLQQALKGMATQQEGGKAPGVLTRMGKAYKGAVGGAKGKIRGKIEDSGAAWASGAKKEMSPTVLHGMGESVAQGVKAGLTPSRKTMAAGLALGAAGTYGLHRRARGRHKRDVQDAVEASIRTPRQATPPPQEG